MSLDRGERFRLLDRIAEATQSSGSGWDWQRKQLLLRTFGLPPLEDAPGGPTFGELVAGASDPDLLGIAELVLGIGAAAALEIAASDDFDRNWKPGYVRMFLSHSAMHKSYVSEVADHLAAMGIHGFVAHESMEISAPWQTQIESALRSMDVFAAIVHPEFLESRWCQQEIGWALGRGIPIFAVRMGADPAGFVGATQWPSRIGASALSVASDLAGWVAQVSGTGDKLVGGLLASLADAHDYYAAEAAAKRLVQLSDLRDDQWDELGRVYWRNDQVHRGVLPSRVLEPFFHMHNRPWPPPRQA